MKILCRSGGVERIFRDDLRDAALLHFDLGILADLYDHVVLADASNLAQHSTRGQDLVTFFQSRNQRRVLLLFLLLRANQQEIESGENDDHWQQEAERVGRRGALCVSVLY